MMLFAKLVAQVFRPVKSMIGSSDVARCKQKDNPLPDQSPFNASFPTFFKVLTVTVHYHPIPNKMIFNFFCQKFQKLLEKMV